MQGSDVLSVTVADRSRTKVGTGIPPLTALIAVSRIS